MRRIIAFIMTALVLCLACGCASGSRSREAASGPVYGAEITIEISSGSVSEFVNVSPGERVRLDNDPYETEFKFNDVDEKSYSVEVISSKYDFDKEEEILMLGKITQFGDYTFNVQNIHKLGVE